MIRCPLTCILVALTFASPLAASTEISIYSDPAGDVMCVSAPVAGAWVEAHVVVKGGESLSAVSFRMVIPPVLLLAEEIAVFPGTVGSATTGVTVAFGTCLTLPVDVLTLRFLVTPLWDDSQQCAFAWIDQATASDCDSQGIPANGGVTRIVRGPCEIIGPSDPSPVDHAHDVPVDVLLEWTAEPASGCALGELLYFSLYFGTDPDPPLVLQMSASPPLDPGDLQPGTQYYWRVLATQIGSSPRVGPVWTFRTTQPVASRTSTWGRIKALYRN